MARLFRVAALVAALVVTPLAASAALIWSGASSARTQTAAWTGVTAEDGWWRATAAVSVPDVPEVSVEIHKSGTQFQVQVGETQFVVESTVASGTYPVDSNTFVYVRPNAVSVRHGSYSESGAVTVSFLNTGEIVVSFTSTFVDAPFEITLEHQVSDNWCVVSHVLGQGPVADFVATPPCL